MSYLIVAIYGWDAWVKLIEAEWRIYASVNLPSFVQIMACRLVSGGRQASSDNGLSPSQWWAPSHYPNQCWQKPGILLIGLLETNFSKFLIENLTFLFKKMNLKVSYAKWRPFCVDLNVLTHFPGGFGCDSKNPIFSLVLLTFHGDTLNSKMNAMGPYWWYVRIGSGNALVPSGNKPLFEPRLSQIYIAIWRH